MLMPQVATVSTVRMSFSSS